MREKIRISLILHPESEIGLKTVTTIILTLILAVPYFGAYLYLNSVKIQNRKEIHSVLRTMKQPADLVLLKFTTKETLEKLRWEHDREFEYNGQMYDIVEATASGDTVIYLCYPDHKETRINKELGKSLARATGQDPSRKSQNDRLTEVFKLTFLQTLSTWTPTVPALLSVNHSPLTIYHSSSAPSPPSPPPKTV